MSSSGNFGGCNHWCLKKFQNVHSIRMYKSTTVVRHGQFSTHAYIYKNIFIIMIIIKSIYKYK